MHTEQYMLTWWCLLLCMCDFLCVHKTLAKQNHKLAVDMPHKLNTQLDILHEQSQDAKVCARGYVRVHAFLPDRLLA